MWRPIKLPNFRFNPAVRSLAVAACIVGYALLVHHVNATGQVSALGAVLALLPVAALGVTLLRNPTSRNAGLMLVLVAGLIAWRAWPQLERHSALLFFLTPLAVWSAFANFLTLPLVALMFVAEFLVRRRVLNEAQGSPLDAVRAYLNRSAGAD